MTCGRSSPEKDCLSADWGQVPFYVVGSATASAASSIRTKFPSSTLTPVDIRGGAESGSAERLADFILKDLPSSNSDKKTLLYLTGDKNLDTLPQKLSSANIALDSIEVYRTGGSSSFQADLDTALKKAPIGKYR